MATRDAFDLFKALDSISEGDFKWYDKLSEEGKKAASPLVLMRWLCGTSDPAQIIRINTFANPYIFQLGADKSLLFKLLSASTTRSRKRYFWLKSPQGKSKTISTQLLSEYFGCSSREAEYYSSVSTSDLISMAEELGWDQFQIKKLQAEIEKDEPSGTKRAISKSKKL